MNEIKKGAFRHHSKASEKYIDVIFTYPKIGNFETSVPIEYRRTGTEIKDEDLDTYLQSVYKDVNPVNWKQWKLEQVKFWSDKPGASITKSFFDVLSLKFSWCCATCDLPSNPNFARRIQDLKEFGFTLATNTRRYCINCSKNTTQLILLPLKRGGITGYETWTPEVRNKIIDVLNSFDAYEARVVKKEGLLPDHKFPEIRWDFETKRDSLNHLSEKEMKNDFQLLTNQRNQQKREVCRSCF
jgi:hypothetical protein